MKPDSRLSMIKESKGILDKIQNIEEIDEEDSEYDDEYESEIASSHL